MSRKKKIKIFKSILTICVLIIFIGIIIYLLPIMKDLSTLEGQIEFKEKVSNSGLLGLLSLFGLQNSMAALNPSGHRYKLTSANESKIYAYLKKDLHNNSIVMPIFNYAIVDIDYQINLQNTELNFEDGEYVFYDAFNDENVNVTIRGGIMSLSSPKESYRCLIIR